MVLIFCKHYNILNLAFQNRAKVIDLLCGDTLSFSDTVNRCTAYAIGINKGISAYTPVLKRIPERIILNHYTTNIMVLLNLPLDNSHNYDYNYF